MLSIEDRLFWVDLVIVSGNSNMSLYVIHIQTYSKHNIFTHFQICKNPGASMTGNYANQVVTSGANVLWSCYLSWKAAQQTQRFPGDVSVVDSVHRPSFDPQLGDLVATTGCGSMLGTSDARCLWCFKLRKLWYDLSKAISNLYPVNWRPEEMGFRLG